MKVELPYWPYYIGDIERDTGYMSVAEFGAYQRLLNRYWAGQGPLPDDDDRLARITGTQLKEWKALRGQVALLFTIDKGAWVCPWMDKQLAKQTHRRIVNTRSGKKGATVRWEGNDEKVS